jgi:hypothetical protein
MYRLRVIVAVVCLVFLFSVVLFPFTNADWIMFRADASHSGVGTGNSVIPTPLWENTSRAAWSGITPSLVLLK